MKLIKIQTKFNCSADDLWNLFSDVTRSDWVPFAKDILLEDNIRTFIMDGVGEIKEQIIDLNNEKKTLSYSVIKSPAPLNHHLAKILVLSEAEIVQLSFGLRKLNLTILSSLLKMAWNLQ